jgi:rhamnulokinase
MSSENYLAFDLGAESGRAVVGTLTGDKLALEEIHRFANEAVEVRGTLYWDVLSLCNNLLKGMRAYAQKFGPEVDAIGIDTWGVDFGLLARDGALLGNPVHYRDRRTEGIASEIERRMPALELFRITGMSLSPIQSLCQLFAMRKGDSAALASTSGLLMMPDLLAYFLGGARRSERTNAVNTQFYDLRHGEWSEEVLRAFDLPRAILPDLVDPGTVVGELSGAVARETGLGPCALVAPCTHDTGSAVAGVPGQGTDWAFLSSGTWSVLGALTGTMVASEAAYSAGFCNELTFGSGFLCRNIMGLWLLQQVRKSWEKAGRSYSYEELVELARRQGGDGPLINPDDPVFLAPLDMDEAIRDYARRTGQREPQGPAETTRCILESLALCYRHYLRTLEQLLGRRYAVLHIVGGGSLNALLCEMTAGATGLAVLAGPVEATVAGNVLVQALSRGRLGSAQDIRDVVRRSTRIIEYEPRDQARWDGRYEQWQQIRTRALV